MSTKFRFFLTAIALLSTGCAAPMTELVATRQSETIDKNLFKEGDKVWVTYQDKIDTVIRKGFVLETDDDSVKLDVGRKRPIDIDYRWIQSIRRPAKDRWYMGVSAGTFTALEFFGQELPEERRFAGPGMSLIYAPYSNGDLEANVSMGGKSSGFSSWISLSCTGHFYTKIPKTYFILGMRIVSAKKLPGEYSPWGSLNPTPRKYLSIVRIGLGVTSPISNRFNMRAEVDLGGLLVHFEREI